MKYKVSEVERENKFHDWYECPDRGVVAALPLLLRPFDAVLGRSIEIRRTIKYRFQNRPGIIDRQANPKR